MFEGDRAENEVERTTKAEIGKTEFMTPLTADKAYGVNCYGLEKTQPLIALISRDNLVILTSLSAGPPECNCTHKRSSKGNKRNSHRK